MNTRIAWFKQRLKDVSRALQPRKKQLEAFRAQWGKPGARDGFLAERHFELTGSHADNAVVDDKTWSDLEFPQIFAHMDSTVTLIGRQMLFHQLRKLNTSPEDLQRRHALYRKMATDAPLRERIQMTLSRLHKGLHNHLTDYLFGEMENTPRHKAAWLAWTLACIALFAVAIFAYLPTWVWMGVLVVNFVLTLKTHWRVTRDNQAMISCMALLDTADTLGSLHPAHPEISLLERLHERRHVRAQMRRPLRWLATIKREPISWLSVWVNLACGLELVLHAFTIDHFFRLRKTIAPDFEYVGAIDAAIAIASFTTRYKNCCQPEWAGTANLTLVDGCHPLLPEGVANSIDLEQRSALVTGSNMAGKTTFIKMLGINVILARTIGLCLASRAVIPPLRVLASIQENHSVASGKSHYFAEIERINSFFTSGQQTHHNLLIIDELFSGTNTIERVAIARSVLEALARESIVLATTHDVELQDSLGSDFDFCHFREDPDVDGFFDYQLRQGATHVHNAIRMLGEMGFPDAVIANAMDYATQETPTAT